MKAATGTVVVHGYALRVIREARGRKIADLAASVGVTRPYLTKIEVASVSRISALLYAALLQELVISDYRALLASPPVCGHEDPEAIPALADAIASSTSGPSS